ncbi:hypothetical protein A3D88_03450 [Candidatus Peribacteria bacterium RIFCSPHIGHO2_02_FULL_52_16]|nr:MAG: hypothetical protein A2706_04265 [Candidatus Peribacteria bacterium RIFCSPHIGHO2_01_FULL_51_35]OGJ61743.1 MAG: hypothetical protein A3D88_03450 [Candidatus Peribacteria bacterium RIFCSPHIGHO2_02_FULL_52_16]
MLRPAASPDALMENRATPGVMIDRRVALAGMAALFTGTLYAEDTKENPPDNVDGDKPMEEEKEEPTLHSLKEWYDSPHIEKYQQRLSTALRSLSDDYKTERRASVRRLKLDPQVNALLWEMWSNFFPLPKPLEKEINNPMLDAELKMVIRSAAGAQIFVPVKQYEEYRYGGREYRIATGNPTGMTLVEMIRETTHLPISVDSAAVPVLNELVVKIPKDDRDMWGALTRALRDGNLRLHDNRCSEKNAAPSALVIVPLGTDESAEFNYPFPGNLYIKSRSPKCDPVTKTPLINEETKEKLYVSEKRHYPLTVWSALSPESKVFGKK